MDTRSPDADTGRWHSECSAGRHGSFCSQAGRPMTDIVLILVTFAFFAVGIAYVAGCDRL